MPPTLDRTCVAEPTVPISTPAVAHENVSVAPAGKLAVRVTFAHVPVVITGPCSDAVDATASPAVAGNAYTSSVAVTLVRVAVKSYVMFAVVDVAVIRGASRAPAAETDAPDAVTCVAVAASSAGVNTSGTSTSSPTTSPTVAATLSGTETISSAVVVSSVATSPSGARIATVNTTDWPAAPATNPNVVLRVLAS